MNAFEEKNAQNESKSQRLLIIDDDVKFSRLLIEYLERHGFQVTSCLTGNSALQLINEASWDAIILDVMLPGLDGYEVLRRIRERLLIPVVMLTALGSDETERIVGLEIGADDYLSKTCSPRELLARLRAVLRRTRHTAAEHAGEAESDMVFGSLVISRRLRNVMLDEELLSLTPVEFDLLVVLAQAKGRVKTREQLLNEIRNRNFDIYDRSIDVHISSLRRKLQEDLRRPQYIKTVRSVGYMFLGCSERGE
jgi:DNA-binding response OmpR family regulator